MSKKGSAKEPQYVMESKTIELMFDLSEEKREKLFELTRTLASILDVNATRRIVRITFKNFHAEADKRVDFDKIQHHILTLGTEAAVH